MRELRDRVAVVTGGASGIGRAMARAFLREGMKVVIADVEEEAISNTLAELGDGEVFGVRTDVSDADSVESLAEEVFSRFGACHLLCNNAGVSVGSTDVWETTLNDWKWVHGVNVMGVVHGILSFVPRMRASGQEGLILNTSSGDGGISPLAGQSVYASSKAAISTMTECLAAQLAAEDGGRLRAAIFYPSGGMLDTGLWTTWRNRPEALAREKSYPEGAQPTFEEFQSAAKEAGFDLPVQNLDELAGHLVEGIRAGDFVIMIGREMIEAQLKERAENLAAGRCPIGAGVMG